MKSLRARTSHVGVLLAAGFGTRLRPATDFRPKPLIPVAGIEPLFFALHRFYQSGLRRVVVNAHHLGKEVEKSVRGWAGIFPDLELRFSHELPEILGTGGALIKILRENADWFRDAGMIVQNGDTLARLDFDRLFGGEQNLFAISTKAAHLERYGPLWIHSTGPLKGTWAAAGSKAGAPGYEAAHFLGVHSLSAKALARLSAFTGPLVPTDLFTGIYQPLIQEGFEFAAVEYFHGQDQRDDEFWFDMNTPAYLLEAQEWIFDRLERATWWQEALKLRHAGINETASGLWTKMGPMAALPRLKAPAVFVDEGGPGSYGAALSVGPFATWIRERGASIDALPSAGESQNAVIVVSGHGETLKSPRLKDSVVVC